MHIYLVLCINMCNFALPNCINMQEVKTKSDRLAILKKLFATRELSSQDEVLQILAHEGIVTTQATLSRDMKMLKVTKSRNESGKQVYVLPAEPTYKRIHHVHAVDLLPTTGFLDIAFSGNMAVVHTRPGYASSVAYNIDTANFDEVLGTIAGDDTIFMVIKQGVTESDVLDALHTVIPEIKK